MTTHGNIRSVETYLNNLIPWDKINGALPRGIRPTDIDGMIECNNYFLFLEAKRQGQTLPKGQEIAFIRLANVSVRINVLVLEWIPELEELGDFYYLTDCANGVPFKILGTGWVELRAYLVRWEKRNRK